MKMGQKSVLAIIPARGGSKGIPRKNIKQFAGKPLIAWTIEEACKSKYISRLILSSDDDEIIEIAKQYGCEVPFKRPKELADDAAAGMLPVLHALQMIDQEYDYVLLLQPTSPLRTVQDIDNCIEYIFKTNSSFVVSINETTKSPYWMYQLDDQGIMHKLIDLEHTPTSRQQLAKVYALNGALYIGEYKQVKTYQTFLTSETKGFIMPSERSFDIDTPLDFWICEQLKKHGPFIN
ncbi:acylneuraminate cytidylyltransferase family protein [Paenibacillus hunanensis]|uniref:acylneuraminate cytidylyltransferase family protein n=1 Tax=Paenibacillus hunanensis TaxID=539262 RepID=UPI002025D4A3|nr:acylneuraminate cytidylyltransferase family protein [Paenibacillus hunanensis]MCL9662778.1 acylneuraminate cytidylyltransferase family protein [Paenibacillus hunanensis]